MKVFLGHLPKWRYLKLAGAAVLSLCSARCSVDETPSTPPLIDPQKCGVKNSVKLATLEAYANGIASETFLEEVQLDSDGRMVFSSESSYTGMFLNDGDPDPERIDQHACLTGKKLAMVKSFWAFARGFDFPLEVAQSVQEHGGTLFLALEPWSWNGAEDVSFSLAKINAGEFDKELRQFFKGAASFEGSLIFSLMHEFNGDWYPWGGNPESFILAWQRIHGIAQDAGAANVYWAWVMNADTVNSPPPEKFYPGDNFVDIVGADGFNFGNVFEWSSWRSFSEIFTNPYAFLYKNYPNKPIIAAEFASAASDQGGDQAVWIGDAIAAMDPKSSGTLPFEAFGYFNMNKEAGFALYSLSPPKNQTGAMGQIAQLRSNPDASADIINLAFF